MSLSAASITPRNAANVDSIFTPVTFAALNVGVDMPKNGAGESFTKVQFIVKTTQPLSFIRECLLMREDGFVLSVTKLDRLEFGPRLFTKQASRESGDAVVTTGH